MTATELRIEEHFEPMRRRVWAAFSARHPLFGRDRFDEAYDEWWTREAGRNARGERSQAIHPVAYLAEGVHNVLIDEARARARGVGRDRKHELQVEDLQEHAALAGAQATERSAHFDAVVHRILELVRDRLSPRELEVFVLSYLYLQGTERVAVSLGLSPPRVKKDKKRIADKCGRAVWSVLSAELDWCRSVPYTDKGLQAVFEVLVDHVDDCRRCEATLAGLRRSAYALAGPLELLALAAAAKAGLAGLLERAAALRDAVVARGGELLGRAAAPGSAPVAGKAATALSVVALAGGGAAAVGVPRVSGDERAPARAPAATRALQPAGARDAVDAGRRPAGRSETARRSTEPVRSRSARRRRRVQRERPAETRSSAPRGAAPAGAPATAPAATTSPAPAGGGPEPAGSSSEFGFERG